MNRMIKAEFFRLSKLRGYKILLFGSVGIGAGEGIFAIVYCVSAGIRPPTWYGYFVLKTFLVFPMFAAIVASIYTAVFLCSEYENRTYGMNLLCGLSRRKVFLSKMTVFYVGLLAIFYFHMIAVSVIVSIAYGFGRLTAADIAEFLKMFLYSVLGYLVLGGYYALLAVWIKNPVATAGLGFMGAYMQMYWRSALRGAETLMLNLSFMYQLDQFLDWETFQDGIYLLVMTVTFLLMFSGALFFYVRSDLK